MTEKRFTLHGENFTLVVFDSSKEWYIQDAAGRIHAQGVKADDGSIRTTKTNRVSADLPASPKVYWDKVLVHALD